MRRKAAWFLALALWLAACQRDPTPIPMPATTPPVTRAALAATTPLPTPVPATPAVLPLPTVVATLPPPPLPSPAAIPTPDGLPRCGLTLPVLAPETRPVVTELDRQASLEDIPQAARPAVTQILRAPGNVSLAAYELGQESHGLYLNPDQPLPLASVVKLIHLVTYAEAVQAGVLDPQQPVLLADLERFYLPNSDLSAHPDAVAALRTGGRVFGEPPAVLLEDVPRMMMEYSSNAATDYLHLLLGQDRLEATIQTLGLASHTAPCPFLGQFLLMGEGYSMLGDYQTDPGLYGADVMAATLAYSGGNNPEAERGWRGRTARPEIEIQRQYSELFNTRASALDYARLMGLIAENQLGPWEQNVRIRRYLEWPTAFPANQTTLAWLGYKGGSLPGVLTLAYYAQPWNRSRPVVVVLFFHNLPQNTYREWRRSLPHDELARWLLYEPDALSTLRRLLVP